MRSPQLVDDFDGDDHGLKKTGFDANSWDFLWDFFLGLFMEFDGIVYDI